jgi:cell division control protein 6
MVARASTAVCGGGPPATPATPSPDRPTAAATLSVAYPADPTVVRAAEAARLRALLDAPTPACVYVCGTPGVGKSLTLSALLRELRTSSDTTTRHTTASAVCWLSCAALPSAAHLPRAVLAALSPEPSVSATTPTSADPWAAVEALVVTPGPRLVLVLDELDLLPPLAARAHAAPAILLPTLFGWARRPRSRLSVVGISNSLSLPESLSRSHSVLTAGAAAPPDLVAFAPYTAAQLIMLVRTRLADAAPDAAPPPPAPETHLNPCSSKSASKDSGTRNANEVGNCNDRQATATLRDAPLGAPAIALAAKRIAASSGDARAMLDVCREAVRQLETHDSAVASPARSAAAVRCVASILARAGGASAAVDTIRALPLQQQLVLCAVARAEQRFSDTNSSAKPVEALSMVALYDAFRKMLAKIGLQGGVLDFREFADVCCDILAGTHGLVHVVDGKKQSSLASRTKSCRLKPVCQRVCKVSKLGPTRFGQSHVSLRTKLVRLKVPVVDVQAGVADRSLLPLIVGKET